MIPLLDQVKTTHKAVPAVVLADAGYCNEEDLVELELRSIDGHVALGREGKVQAAELIEYVSTVPEWLDGDYISPLVKRVATIRREILQRAKDSAWVLDEAQLTDQAIIRRLVLKRCIYGVDKNRSDRRVG